MKTLSILLLSASLSFVTLGCGDDDVTDTTPPPPVDANMPDTSVDMDAGDDDGGGDDAGMMIDLMGYDIRTDDAASYTRVDRIGLPAVSTAFAGTMSDSYNDGNPTDDAMLTYGPLILGNLGGLHAIIDDDLIAASLTPCNIVPPMMGVPPACATQEIIPGSGITVASVLLPDTLKVNPDGAPGFPNGRRLVDPVMDVTLSVLLLDMTSTDGCGGSACTPTTLVGTNPVANDVPFAGETDPTVAPTTFPYLAPAQTP